MVDDDPSIVAIVSETLTGQGHLLVDMRMPVLDGWGFARAFRASGKRSPIVVAAGYLAKPFEIDALIAAVERHATGTR